MLRDNLAGKRFGRLTVINYSCTRVKPSGQKYAVWKCKCDCGHTLDVAASSLKSGNTMSCGCYHSERASAGRTTHGKSYTKLYYIFRTMHSRCENSNVERYPRYGGRGIQVCGEWKAFEPFYEWAIKSGYKDGLSIDRINVDGNYEPNNCKWSTSTEQARNKSNSRRAMFNGKERTISEISEITGINYNTLWQRVNKGTYRLGGDNG